MTAQITGEDRERCIGDSNYVAAASNQSMQKATNRWGGKQDFGDGSCQKVAMDGWTVNEAWRSLKGG